MTKVNFRIVTSEVKEKEGRKEKRAGFFSVKFFLRKKKIKANIAKISICQIWIEVYRITAGGDCSHEIKRRLLLGRKVMTNLDGIFRSQGHYFANKGPSSQGYGFSCGHVWM